MKVEKKGWRNWGDNPIVVAISALGGIATVAAIVIPLLTAEQPPGRKESTPQPAPEKLSASPWALPKARRLSYLQLVPILDKTLYFGRYTSELVLGGVNIRKVQVAFRTRVGDTVRIRWDSDQERFRIPYDDDPVIEMQHKGKYVEIEVVKDNDDPVFSIREIERTTMDLKATDKLRVHRLVHRVPTAYPPEFRRPPSRVVRSRPSQAERPR